MLRDGGIVFEQDLTSLVDPLLQHPPVVGFRGDSNGTRRKIFGRRRDQFGKFQFSADPEAVTTSMKLPGTCHEWCSAGECVIKRIGAATVMRCVKNDVGQCDQVQIIEPYFSRHQDQPSRHVGKFLCESGM